MRKIGIRIGISILSIIAILISIFSIAISASAESKCLAPVIWFTDDYQHNNPLVEIYDDSANEKRDVFTTEIISENGTDNKVLKISKSTSYSSNLADPTITVFPQQADGTLAYVGDETPSGIAPASGKTYRYIIEYKYKLISTSGSYGAYINSGVASENTSTFKNSQSVYLLNSTQNTTAIGSYNRFEVMGDIDVWHTVSTAVTYSSSESLSKPVIALNFKIAKAFKGEFYIDDVVIKRVDESDTTSTVILNPKNNNQTRYNPITYVTGADYTLPTPTRDGYEFVGWYADSNYSVLCENSLPTNNVDGLYTVLYARWIENALTDDFDQKTADNRFLSGDFEIIAGEGKNGTKALKYSSKTNQQAVMIPKDLKGKDYCKQIEENKLYNYILSFWYKANTLSTSEQIEISFDLVKKETENSVTSTSPFSLKISNINGNDDGKWHKASFALRFKGSENGIASVALKFNATVNTDILIDDISLTEELGSIGSFTFVGDEFTGYFDPTAGETGNRTELSVPDRSGYIFKGWQTANEQVITTVTFGVDDYVLYPKWEKLSAPNDTSLVISDNFDETLNNRDVASNNNVGPDASSWDIATFEQYATEDFNVSGYSDYNFSVDTKYSINVESELDGNHYLRIVNAGSNSANIMHKLWFRDVNNNIVGEYNQGNYRTGVMVVTYKFRYKINADTEGSYGMYMKSSVIRSDNYSNDQTDVFALAKNKKPNDDTGTSSRYYGIGDGNWHTASFSAVHTINNNGRNKVFYPGFWMDASKRKVDICLDDIAIDVQYYTNSVGNNTALNFKFNTDYKNDDNKVVTGPLLDTVTANYGESANLPIPVVSGKVFDGWYFNDLPFDSENISLSRPTNGHIVLTARYRERNENDALESTFDIKIKNGFGTGKTNALSVSSSTAGNGLINLLDSNGLKYSVALSENQKVNWLVRFRYKAKDIKTSVSVNFDLAAPNSGLSLSKEGGTSLGFEVNKNNSDENWHTAILPVSLTRNAINSADEVTLLINIVSNDAFSEILFDEFELFDAGENKVSGIRFNGKIYVDPIAGIVGKDIILPQSPNAEYSVGGWFKDEKLTDLYAKAETPIKLEDSYISLFGEFLTPDGFYAVERFDRTLEIYEEKMTSSAGLKSIWDQHGLRGKLRSFQITDEVCHDEDGAGNSLKYDIDGINDTYSSILLTDNKEDQIYLGTKTDEDEQIYLVSFWYKIERADTDIQVSLSGCNYNCMWEQNSFASDVVVFPVLHKSDGWQQMKVYLPISWKLSSAGENAKDIYALFTVKGQGLAYFDDFEFTKVNNGLAESIYFDTDGAGFVAPYTGIQGEKIPELPVVQKEGYEFKGWYTDYSFETKFDRTIFGGDGTDANCLGATYLYAQFEEVFSSSEDEEEIIEELPEEIIDDEIETERPYTIEYIYEDILEEISNTTYRKKTTITREKISDGGPSLILIVIIIAVSVILVAGSAVTIILLKKKGKKK